MFCFQARPCIIQPGNFTRWDSEGVKHWFAKGRKLRDYLAASMTVWD